MTWLVHAPGVVHENPDRSTGDPVTAGNYLGGVD